ncbi:MAG: hypothetical protein ACTHMT_06770 [Verrucomicrobiota bacterium]|jgi:hypothetical protein
MGFELPFRADDLDLTEDLTIVAFWSNYRWGESDDCRARIEIEAGKTLGAEVNPWLVELLN